MDDWRADRIGSALRGENPTVLAHLPTGFAVIGDSQFLPGYCLLLSDDPAADRLADLPRVAGWRSWPIWIFWVRRFTSFVRGVSPDFAG